MQRFFLTGLLGIVLASHSLGQENSAEQFYRNKVVNYLVSGEPGTGYDLMARLLSRHMEKYLPGTRIRIQNVTGAGGIVAANLLYRTRPDGLSLGTLNIGLVYTQLQQLEGVRFDLREFEWIGKAEADPRVLYTAAATNILTLEQFLNYQGRLLMVATTGAGSASNNDALMMARALGLNIEMVTFSVSSEGNLSMLRGEVHGRIGSYATVKRFVDSGGGILLASIGKSARIQEPIPDLMDFAVDDTGRSLLRLIESVSRFGRFTVMPPGEDQGRVAYIRDIYMKTLSDADFLAEAARLELDIEPMYGEALAREIQSVLDQPQAVIDQLKSLSN